MSQISSLVLLMMMAIMMVMMVMIIMMVILIKIMNGCKSRSDGWDGTGGWVSPDVLGFAIIFYKCLLEKSILFCGLDARRLLLYPFCVERTAESLLILLVCIQSQHTAARGPGWTFPNLTEHAFCLE